MQVTLTHHTPLSIMATAGRTAWQSFHKGGIYDVPTDTISDADQEFLNRIVNKHKHGSVAEAVTYNFEIKNISRGCLIELTRHRIASLTVKSSRYSLGELKKEEPFLDYSCVSDGTYEPYTDDSLERAKKYIKFTDDMRVNVASMQALDNLRDLVQLGLANDISKYALPECYYTSLVWTINARSLQNFIALRSSPSALWEIRDLARHIYDAIPADHQFLFTSHLHEDA